MGLNLFWLRAPFQTCTFKCILVVLLLLKRKHFISIVLMMKMNRVVPFMFLSSERKSDKRRDTSLFIIGWSEDIDRDRFHTLNRDREVKEAVSLLINKPIYNHNGIHYSTKCIQFPRYIERSPINVSIRDQNVTELALQSFDTLLVPCWVGVTTNRTIHYTN